MLYLSNRDQVLQMYAGFLQRRDAIPSGLRHINLYKSHPSHAQSTDLPWNIWNPKSADFLSSLWLGHLGHLGPRPGLTASAPRWLTDVSPFAHAFAAMISSEFTGLETTVDATGALGQRFANPPWIVFFGKDIASNIASNIALWCILMHPEHAFAELTDLRFWCIDSWRRCPKLRFPQTSWPHLELLPELCHAKIWPKQFSVDPTKLEHNVQMLALVACFAWILALIPLWLQWCPCLIKFKFYWLFAKLHMSITEILCGLYIIYIYICMLHQCASICIRNILFQVPGKEGRLPSSYHLQKGSRLLHGSRLKHLDFSYSQSRRKSSDVRYMQFRYIQI